MELKFPGRGDWAMQTVGMIVNLASEEEQSAREKFLVDAKTDEARTRRERVASRPSAARRQPWAPRFERMQVQKRQWSQQRSVQSSSIIFLQS
jgi:hypothetical protein